MNDLKWHKGKPPHVGFWLTTPTENPDQNHWRWWDGEGWSVAMYEDELLDSIDFWAGVRSYYTPAKIEWSDYYPADARVPRRKP